MQHQLGQVALILGALVLCSVADAARKTPSCRLSSQATAVGAHTASCDIPSGTTSVLVGVNFAGGSAPTSVSIDGQTATKKVSDETVGAQETAIYEAHGVSTGTGKTVAWTNAANYSGLDIGLEYRDGTLAFGATDADDCNACGTLTTLSLANSNNDEFLCFYANSDNAITSVGAGQTQLDDTIGVSEYGFTTKTTAGSSTTSSFTFSSGFTGYSCVIITTTNPPTYTSAPAISGRTTSSVTVSQTSACTDCTAYFVAETDALGIPTCTQIKAGNGADGNAAYKSANGAMTANVAKTLTLSTWTDGNKKDGYGCMNSTANGDSAVSAIADMDKIPVAACTYSSATSGGATYSCTLDGPGTIYGVACIKDSTDATVAQVTAAHCTGDVAAKASANRSGTGSLTVGTNLPNPVYDFSFVGAYNFGSQVEAATHQDFDRCLANPTGKQIINCPNGLTSIASGSAVEALNVLITPDWAIGDIPVCDATTTPGGYGPISPATTLMTVTGLVSYSAGGDTSRQYVNCDAYDVSVGAMMTVANANNDLDWYNNDPSIVCSSPFSTSPYVVKTNVAMNVAPNIGNIDFTTKCAHPLGDSLTFALTSGTLPTGLSLATPILSGTATVENESGAPLIVTGSSAVTGGTGTQPFTIYPLTTVTMPDCVSSLTLQLSCSNSILAAYKSAIAIGITFANDNTIPVGYVISQNPAAGTEVAPFETESIVVSLGSAVVTVQVPKCIGGTFIECLNIVAQTSSAASVTSTCAANDEVYSQSPAVGKTVDQSFNLLALCR